jgi:hypothetical protein
MGVQLRDDDVVARLRAGAPGYPDAGPDAERTLGAARRALRRRRGLRSVGGVAAVVAAVVGLMAVGPIELPRSGTPSLDPPPQTASPSPSPSPSVSPSAGEDSCQAGGQPVGPASAPIPPAPPGRRHPPFRIVGLPGAGGAVVSSPQYPHAVPGRATRTIGNVLLDHEDYYYVTAKDSSRLYLHVETGTPKAGVCALELVYTALRGEDGLRAQRIATLLPGPALGRHNAAFACGMSSSGSGLSVCAWAATSAGDRTLFGMMEIMPIYKPDGFAEHQLSETEIIATADIVFGAIDG